MEPLVIDHEGVPLLACSGELATASDALTFVSAALDHDARGLLLEASQFPPAFADLRTGFAGEFVQKLQNYQLRTAAVFATDEGYGERFREFLLEARKSSGFRVFGSRDDALAWLVTQAGASR